jgi:hypothetical protein
MSVNGHKGEKYQRTMVRSSEQACFLDAFHRDEARRTLGLQLNHWLCDSDFDLQGRTSPANIATSWKINIAATAGAATAAAAAAATVQSAVVAAEFFKIQTRGGTRGE